MRIRSAALCLGTFPGLGIDVVENSGLETFFESLVGYYFAIRGATQGALLLSGTNQRRDLLAAKAVVVHGEALRLRRPTPQTPALSASE